MTRTLYKKNFTFQRRSESPMLSMAALLGSVVLHAVAFCSIRLGAVDSVHTVEKEPVSVELIELPPIVESRKPVSGVVINSKILPPIATKPITSQGSIPDGEVIAKSQKKVAAKPAARSPQPKPVPKPTVAVKPAARSPQPKPAPKPTVAVKPAARSPQPKSAPKPTVAVKPVARSPQPKPAPKPTVAVKPVARSPQPKPAPKPTVAVKPVVARSPQPKPAPKPAVTPKPAAVRSPQPKPAPKPAVTPKPAARSPQPKPAPKPTVTPKPAARSPQPKPTVTPKPVVVRAGSVRAMPYPPPSLGDRKPATPTPPVPSPKPQPSGSQNNGGVIATFDLGSIRSGERDIPDQLAKPVQNQREFSPVLDPLQIGLISGSALTLEVLVEIDEKGKLTIIKQVNPVEDGTQGQSGAKTFDYLSFAKELLKNWQFQAAHSGGQAVYSELWLRLTVKAL